MSERYDIELTRDAEKDLKALRPWTEQATAALLRLEDDPQLGHLLVGSLRGVRSLEFSLKGGGAYRAMYIVIPDEHVCVVFLVGAHENIYKKAERRYQALMRRAM